MQFDIYLFITQITRATAFERVQLPNGFFDRQSNFIFLYVRFFKAFNLFVTVPDLSV